MEQLPLLAIVGEPNVGKSTLMNKIAGKRIAVTSVVAGTTRDRQYVDTVWNGVDFTMIDTAGVTFGNAQELEAALTEQIDVAMNEATMLMLVVDGKESVDVIDRKALLKFRKIKKPIVVAVNKLDSPKNLESFAAPFLKLGIKHVFPVSAVTGRGIGDMLDQISLELKKVAVEKEVVPVGIAVSIVGKPNVGKSSLLNHILGQKRVVVSPIPGTTRTSIDTHTTIDGQDYTFIDTAGLKRKDHRQKQPDVFSGFQTFKAIRRSDIVILVIDAIEQITKQDQVIAGEIFDFAKGAIIVANKMDLYEGDEEKLQDYISLHFPFLWFSPVFLISAETGDGVDKALAAIKPIYENRLKEIEQEKLDAVLEKTLKNNPPKRLRDQRVPKVYGIEQVETNPPNFVLWVNRSGAISTQYRRFLLKHLIKHLDLWGTPIKLHIRQKE
ncbi:MAG TPA: ribosome biogenesis GTPase Der [Patescibacteria group bacterium]|jgi:GTP-binding protein|nr:ribosome biogenesis GTPase Der [Patescibacteria group bacterium]